MSDSNDQSTAQVTFQFDINADLMGCLFQGLISALPAFLDAFMKCMASGGNGSTGYHPGERNRCDN